MNVELHSGCFMDNCLTLALLKKRDTKVGVLTIFIYIFQKKIKTKNIKNFRRTNKLNFSSILQASKQSRAYCLSLIANIVQQILLFFHHQIMNIIPWVC